MTVHKTLTSQNQAIPLTHCESWDLVSSVVFPILSIIAAGFSIHYILNPSGPVVQISSDLSMRLPLLVTGSTFALSLVIFLIQMARPEKVKKAFYKWLANWIVTSSSLQYKVRELMYPGKKAKHEGIYYKPNRIYQFRGIKNYVISVDIKTIDGKKLRGYWNNQFPNRPTVICFHGNAVKAEDQMFEWLDFFVENQCNVLFVEYRGYGDSEGEAGNDDSETNAYNDMNAALNFVKTQNPHDRIITYGYSLGGAYSAAAGYFCNCDGVILDHTFSSLEDLIADLSGMGKEDANRIARACFPSNNRIADQFNTLEKVKQMKSKVLVLSGENDTLISKKHGERLALVKGQSLHLIRGGHNDPDDEQTKVHIKNFLQQF